jgi:hypothetical protein
MPIVRTALLAAAASLIAVAAYAQPDTGAAPSVPQTPPDNSQAAPPMTDNGAMQAPAQTPPPADPSATTGAATDTSATVDANGVIWHAAQPIPDTPANRAADGQPMSRTGRLTKPIGD